MAQTHNNPFFGVKHIPTRSMLPDTPTLGIVYFVSDEGVLVVNHGKYVSEYGKGKIVTTMSDGWHRGSFLSVVQNEINDLALSVFSILNAIEDQNTKANDFIDRTLSAEEDITEDIEALKDAIGEAQAALSELAAKEQSDRDHSETVSKNLQEQILHLTDALTDTLKGITEYIIDKEGVIDNNE